MGIVGSAGRVACLIYATQTFIAVPVCGGRLPSAAPIIPATPAEQQKQHQNQDNQLIIAHDLSLSLIKPNRVPLPLRTDQPVGFADCDKL
jgi:hypothetical protein